jgi:YbbR domain-containing protein
MSKNPEEILALISIRRTFSTREIEVQVNVQLSGPQQLITQVDRQLGFVSVTLNLAGYETGLHRVRLETEVPQDLSVELFPSEIRVRLDAQQ